MIVQVIGFTGLSVKEDARRHSVSLETLQPIRGWPRKPKD